MRQRPAQSEARCRGAGRVASREEELGVQQQQLLEARYDELRDWAGQLDVWRPSLELS